MRTLDEVVLRLAVPQRHSILVGGLKSAASDNEVENRGTAPLYREYMSSAAAHFRRSEMQARMNQPMSERTTKHYYGSLIRDTEAPSKASTSS